MDIKPRPNHELTIKALRAMTPEQRLLKAFELSEFAKELFWQGLKNQYPDRSEAELRPLYLQRLALCHNRNY